MFKLRADAADLAVILMATLLALQGIVDRNVLYFDEVINASRAFRDVEIFNYASRPLFYAMNRLVVDWIGKDLLSLRLWTALLYVATSWLLFRMSRGSWGTAAGWLTMVAYSCSVVVLFHGIRAMPHLPAGFFSTLSLLAAAGAWQGRKSLGFLSGMLAAAAVGSHPTLVAFAAALAAITCLEVLFVRRREQSPRAWARRVAPHLWLLMGLVVGCGLLLAVYLVVDPRHIDGLRAMVTRVQHDPQYARSAQGPLFYPGVMLRDPAVSSLILVAIAVAAIAGLRRQREAVTLFLSDRPTVRLVTLALLSMTVLTVARWKFERVLVAFVPLLALAATAIVAQAWQLARSPEVRRKVTAAIVLLVVTAAGAGAWRASRALRADDARRSPDYLRSAEIVRGTSPEDALVGYIGPPWGGRRISQITALAERRPKILNQFLHDRPDRQTLEEAMVRRGARLLWVAKPLRQDEREELVGWRDAFRFYRPLWLHGEGKLLDLWMLVPEDGLDDHLGALTPASTVAVWDDSLDVGFAAAAWTRDVVAAQGLKALSLSLKEPVEPRLATLRKRGVDHVLLVPGSRPAAVRRLEAVRRVLARQAAERLKVDPRTAAELWRLSPKTPPRSG